MKPLQNITPCRDKYFVIESTDIYGFERILINDDIVNEDQAKLFIERLQEISFNSEKALVKNDDPDYLSAKKNILDKQPGFKSKLYQGYFFSPSDQLYTYYANIDIKPDSKDFDYFFALKLRQFDDRILICEFLDFQQENNFKNDTIKFVRFIESIVAKYRSNFIFSDTIGAVEYWIRTESQRTSKAVSTVSLESENNLEKDPEQTLYTAAINDKQMLDNVVEALMSHCPNNSKEEIEQAFSGQNPSRKINFNGFASQLGYLIIRLQDQDLITPSTKLHLGKWISQKFNRLEQTEYIAISEKTAIDALYFQRNLKGKKIIRVTGLKGDS